MTPTLSSLSALATEHARLRRERAEHIEQARVCSAQLAQIELHAAIAGVALDARTQSGEVRG